MPNMVGMQTTFGRRLRQLRLQKNWTMQELGRQVGLTRQTIYKLEQYGANPRLTTLRALARALGTTTDELISEKSVNHG